MLFVLQKLAKQIKDRREQRNSENIGNPICNILRHFEHFLFYNFKNAFGQLVICMLSCVGQILTCWGVLDMCIKIVCCLDSVDKP